MSTEMMTLLPIEQSDNFSLQIVREIILSWTPMLNDVLNMNDQSMYQYILEHFQKTVLQAMNNEGISKKGGEPQFHHSNPTA